MARMINAPGTEIHEIDRSQYSDKEDYSIVGTTTLICGFADKGEDYTPQWINSEKTLVDYYGYPSNEAEKYFYNAGIEILDKGGLLVMSKLPYDNQSKDRYCYIDYKVDVNNLSIIGKKKPDNDPEDDNPGDNDPEDGGDGENPGGNVPTLKNEQLKVLTLNTLYGKVNELFEQIKDIIEFKGFGWNGDTSDLIGVERALEELGIKWNGEKYKLSDVKNNVDLIAQQILTRYYDLKKDYDNLADSKAFIDFKNKLSTDLTEYINRKFNDIVNGSNDNEVESEGYSNYLSAIKNIDESISSYIEIKNIYNENGSGLLHMSNGSMNINAGGSSFDDLKTSNKKVKANTFRIVDITRAKYDRINLIDKNGTSFSRECLGIMPVIVTPTIAMYFQGMLNNEDDSKNAENATKFNLVSNIMSYSSVKGKMIATSVNDNTDCFSTSLSSSNIDDNTVSKIAAQTFPIITKMSQKSLDRRYLKQIGVVVFKAEKDEGNRKMIQFTPVEAFVGSFDKDDKDQDTHASLFIDDIINSNSNYINFFSNVTTGWKNYKNASTLHISNQDAITMGFLNEQCIKNIDFKNSIVNALGTVFDQCKDPNVVPIDVVLDAGMSTIGAWCNCTANDDNGSKIKRYDPTDENATFNTAFTKSGDNAALTGWRVVLEKYDNFTKNTRKDCIFVADALRSFCLNGNSQIVRKTLPTTSVKKSIVPYVDKLISLNSNYSAGYCNWFYMRDSWSGDLFWCPPSIKVGGVYTHVDAYYKAWDAPAGITRATLDNVIDCAFTPNAEEAGYLYNHCWNYAVNYPLNGIVIEGQKTFQMRKTAFDRVNVRRGFLDLEKKIKSIARYYVYEGNTEYLRQRFVDAITEILDEAQIQDGIAEYAIKCDETNNPPSVIDNNELHCTIAIRPVKSTEFIVLNFIATNQSANVAEQLNIR